MLSNHKDICNNCIAIEIVPSVYSIDVVCSKFELSIQDDYSINPLNSTLGSEIFRYKDKKRRSPSSMPLGLSFRTGCLGVIIFKGEKNISSLVQTKQNLSKWVRELGFKL